MLHTGGADISPGGSSEAAPPVPIPNTAVKRFSAYDTALVTEWENRSPPGGISTHSYQASKLLHLSSLRLRCFQPQEVPLLRFTQPPLIDACPAGLTIAIILGTRLSLYT